MKIRYDYQNTKEVRHVYNIALGIYFQSFCLLNLSMKNERSLLNLSLSGYLRCILYGLSIALFSEFINLSFIEYFFAFLLLLRLIISTFQLFIYFISLYLVKDTSGEIEFSEEGILDTSVRGKCVYMPYRKAKLLYLTEETIYIFTNSIVYFFPYSSSNEEIVKEVFAKYKPNTKVIKQNFSSKNGLRKFWRYWGISIFLSLFIFSFLIFYDLYNSDILDKEIRKIWTLKEVDNRIISYQKYGIVERYIKEYYTSYYAFEKEYEEYSAVGTLKLITVEMLKENKEELISLLKGLEERQKKASNALENLIFLHNQDNVLKKIMFEDLGDYYIELYLSYIFQKNNFRYLDSLQEEIVINKEKMRYLEQLIKILITYKDVWGIEENQLYFYDEDILEEYNHLYDLIVENTIKSSDGLVM